MPLKENVYKKCMEVVDNKVHLLRHILNDLKESASNETKSTAGDKHETALAMLQIEQENTNKQLENLLLQKLLLQKIIPGVQPQFVANGTLVKTNKGNFFLSIALGKILVEGTEVIALSPKSPLGSKLLGLNVSEAVSFNGMTYVIKSIE